MTRKRYERLVRALTMRIAEKVGFRNDGAVWRHQRDNIADHAIKNFGSYQAAWDARKDMRDFFGFQ